MLVLLFFLAENVRNTATYRLFELMSTRVNAFLSQKIYKHIGETKIGCISKSLKIHIILLEKPSKKSRQTLFFIPVNLLFFHRI